MEKFRLTSMVDFVLEQEKKCQDNILTLKEILNYANFLKQPLKLEMFVCCDDEGNVLLGKPLSPATDEEWDRWKKEQPIYQQAKGKVLFEGFEFKEYHKPSNSWFIKSESVKINDSNFIRFNRIELLTIMDLTLTQSALKQIGI